MGLIFFSNRQEKYASFTWKTHRENADKRKRELRGELTVAEEKLIL